MSRPRAFVEAPAGLASVSLRLHGGERCRPPISRMGNKAGYSGAILGALGLQSGSGADCYVWAEADQDVAALLRAYPDPAMLRRIAEIIRGWSSEEPRALWERLRAERKARGARVDDEGVAGWMYDTANAHGGTGGWKVVPAAAVACGVQANLSVDGLSDRCHRLAEYATIAASNRLINVADDGTGDLRNTGAGGTTFGGAEFATPPGDVAGRFEEVAGSIAGLVAMSPWAYREGVPESGFCQSKAVPGVWSDGATRAPRTEHLTGAGVERATVGGWPPVLVLPTIPEAADLAAMLGTPGDLEGVVCYSDPPYLGTTGYRHTLPRAEVVRFALDYAALGAVVCVSEAEALPELVAAGWHVAEITAGRVGQRRTFSKQQGEFLTMNREPAHRVAVQSSLFAMSAP